MGIVICEEIFLTEYWIGGKMENTMEMSRNVQSVLSTNNISNSNIHSKFS